MIEELLKPQVLPSKRRTGPRPDYAGGLGTRPRKPAWLGNPWGLSLPQCRVLVAIAEMTPREAAKHLGIQLNTIRSHTLAARAAMGVVSQTSIAVQFDRWWQNWQRAAALTELEAAQAQLGL